MVAICLEFGPDAYRRPPQRFGLREPEDRRWQSPNLKPLVLRRRRDDETRLAGQVEG